MKNTVFLTIILSFCASTAVHAMETSKSEEDFMASLRFSDPPVQFTSLHSEVSTNNFSYTQVKKSIEQAEKCAAFAVVTGQNSQKQLKSDTH